MIFLFGSACTYIFQGTNANFTAGVNRHTSVEELDYGTFSALSFFFLPVTGKMQTDTNIVRDTSGFWHV